MYMKRFLLLLALLLPLAASAQYNPHRPSTWSQAQIDSARAHEGTHSKLVTHPNNDSLMVATVLYVRDTNLLPASVYLQRSAACQTREMIFAVAGGAFIGLAVANPDQDGVPNFPLMVVGGASALVAIINHFAFISNTRKAGKALSRVRLQSNGITIDL